MLGRAVTLTYKMARRIAVAVVGSTVLAVGVALIVLPGPALLVIPIGLAILSLEFAWARLWLRKVRETLSRQGAESRADRASRHQDRPSR